MTESAWAPADWQQGRKPKILLAVPCERVVPLPFLQSICGALLDPELVIEPYLVSGTVVHLARNDAIQTVRDRKDFDFLGFVDSDQVWSKLILRRLVSWNAPMVSPLVVQRNGDPIPVVYREIGQDQFGRYRHDVLLAPIVAYLSQFDCKWWDGPTGILPLVPDVPGGLTNDWPEVIKNGLGHPLLPCDATGFGMTLIRRDVVDSVEPDPKNGLFLDFAYGGEDYSWCRAVRRAGWGGCDEGPRGWGIFADRGAFIGHLTAYSRGIHDLAAMAQEMESRAKEKDERLSRLPPAMPDLVDALRAEHHNGRAKAGWMDTPLPGELALGRGGSVGAPGG